ncbi:MAG TPA: hypothetical protein PLE51_03560 [Candidatus Pacearchaeota archaeon]|nr:hypothetical protein [Candidatus Pacearchaeota archaeon]
MEEIQRVTTTKQSNKIVNSLLIIAGVLGLALIAVAIYFYMIKPSTTTTVETQARTCVCYYVDPTVTTECGDPRKGFSFKQVTTQTSSPCQNSCPTSDLTVSTLDSSTKQELFLSCSLQNVQDTRCTEMTIKNSNGKIITGDIEKDDEITVEAKFDKKYSDPKFKVNNTIVKPDTISDDGLTIKKTLTSFTTTSIDIVATANGGTGDEINSPLCKRLIEVKQKGQSSVIGLILSRRNDETTTKISQAVLRIANITSTDDIKISFSFDNDKFSKIDMTKGFSFNSDKGEISIIEQDLYNTENFTQGVSFTQLDGYTGTLSVQADILKAETLLGSATSKVVFDKISKEEPKQNGSTQEEPTQEEPTQEQPKQEEPTQSNFALTTTTNLTCLERVVPNNSVIVTINITNNAEASQNILSIKDKLPLGFIYLPNSSKINNLPISDSTYLKTNQIGNTTELTWSTTKGWSISSKQSLTLVFEATAGENALTGENQNEVVIEPAQVPTNPSSLRASSVINVEQSCSSTPITQPEKAPKTGLFDNIVAQIMMGIIILTLGWYIYTKPFGQILIKKLVNSEAYKEAEMTSWKIFKPKKYFEEITIRRMKKK